MKILFAEQTGCHPYWNRNEYSLFILDTETNTATIVPQGPEPIASATPEIFFTAQGVEIEWYGAGTGYGKVAHEGTRRLLVPKTAYDKLIIWHKPSMQNGMSDEDYLKSTMI